MVNCGQREERLKQKKTGFRKLLNFFLDCSGLLNLIYLKSELREEQWRRPKEKQRQKRWGLDKQREGRDSEKVED